MAQPAKPTVYARLGRLLRRIRRAKDMTQKKLGEKLHRGQSFVAKYEAGDRMLDVVEFVCVVRALGVPPAKIVRRLERMILPDENNVAKS